MGIYAAGKNFVLKLCSDTVIPARQYQHCSSNDLK